jgi:ribulose-5-phosphate 4-epimerase/fuculose-1-phosphate aldolase
MDKTLRDSHHQARIDLAAAFRWAARLGLHESIANHFSVAVSDDGRQFLLNPVGRHFSRVRASELLLLDAGDAGVLDGPDAPDPTAWYLHAERHGAVLPAGFRVPHARPERLPLPRPHRL